MAQALVTYLNTSRQEGYGTRLCVYSISFWGTDVSEELATGLQVECSVLGQSNIAALKPAVVAAVIARAAEVGVTVAAGDIYLQSLETGTVAPLSYYSHSMVYAGI